MERCVFLDRDGTLIEDRGYVCRVEDYARLPGALEGLRLLRDDGYRLVIVTNQSGIGRGLYEEAAFRSVQGHLERDFSAAGITFAGTYFCPHTPEAGCACRKPAPGLIERAARDLDLDVGASWVIGDKTSDVELARSAGCRGAVHVRTGATAEASGAAGAASAGDLEAAARIVLASRGQVAQ